MKGVYRRSIQLVALGEQALILELLFFQIQFLSASAGFSMSAKAVDPPRGASVSVSKQVLL